MKIALLAGGDSPERDVSLVSAGKIAAALCKKGHRVALIDSYLGLDLPENIDSLFVNTSDFSWKIEDEAPDLDKLKTASGNGESHIGKNVLTVCAHADIVYIGLHGGIGEDGQLQALFDCLGKKYTGTGYIGSTLAMDKDITKKMFLGAGVPCPEGITAFKDTPVDFIEKTVGYPAVIKPCSCGSSVGVSIVHDLSELKKGLELAFFYENKVLVEKKVEGREMTVGILKGKTLPPVEIIPRSGFYDYKNKYQGGMTTEICPPDITEEEAKLLSDVALKAANALYIDVSSYCRVDMFLTENGAVALEVNTLPGMTPTSLIPKEAEAVGMSYEELCDTIARCALEK